MYLDPQIVSAAIAAGASGYLIKDAPPHELANAWRKSTQVSATWISSLP
jgi:DNA-binding NarL/FixJ family response regulator